MGQLTRAGAVRGTAEEIGLVVIVAAGPVTHPDDARAVGRPRLGAIVGVAVGDLLDGARRHIGDEEVRARIEGVALPIGLVLRARDVTWPLLPALPSVGVGGWGRDRNTRREQQARAIRGPRRRPG